MTDLNKKRGLAFSVSALAYVLCFLLYYLSTFIFESTALSYAFFFYKDALEAIFPIFILALVLPSFIKNGFKGALLPALILSSAELLYTLPAHLFEYAYAGYEIGSVVLFSFLFSLLSYVTVYATVLLLLILFLSVTKLSANKKSKSDRNAKPALDTKIDLFDFSNSFSLGLVSACAAIFIYKLALEIYDTVLFLVNYSGTYTVGEIIYLTARYLFILFTFIASYFLAHQTRRYLSK